jgi:hypothetical protein
MVLLAKPGAIGAKIPALACLPAQGSLDVPGLCAY